MNPPRRNRLVVEDVGNVAIITFINQRVLQDYIEDIGNELFSLSDVIGRKRILINFKNVIFLACPIIGKFLALDKKLRSVGGKLILCSMAPMVYEAFETVRLESYFIIFKEEQAALQAFD